ncbi:hypothetical protein KUTeg_021159 [Tegillarca granosa]|uniref:Receptor ligand binding region domain-containing protein n=1 Tax=Tegillarca granosa TaxID=220873 RepID=A0ABQ9EF39_TEGGR|nr:hypothetical protein KUTeg_021159 [Tegillarca granosa]
MEELGWTYVAAIHTDDNYGRDGIEGIQKLAKERGICIQTVISLKITLSNDDRNPLDDVITALKEQMDRAKDKMLGVVYFGQKNIIEQVLINANLKSKFDQTLKNIHWIMCDFVGTSISVFREASDFAHGTLTVSTSAILFKEARTYFLNQWNTVNENANQDQVKILMKEYKGQPEHATVTTESWRNDFTLETMDAVYVFVTALKDTFRVKCQQYTSICEGFDSFLKANYLNYLKNVKLNYSEIPEEVGPKELISIGKLVKFNEHGDLIDDGSVPLYNINKYNHNSSSNTGKFNVVSSF